MNWLYIVLACLIGLPLLVLLIGLCLDRDHVASVTFTLHRPPAEVFAVIADHQGAAKWRSDLQAVEVQPPVAGRARFLERGANGPIAFEVVRSEPPALHELRIADDTLAFGGGWRFELSADGSGTRVVITEDGFVKNPIFRTLSRSVFSLTATLEGYARALGRRFGEDVEPATTLAHGHS